MSNEKSIKKPKKEAVVESVIVEYDDSRDPEFKAPSNWHIQNCLGQLVYFCCRDKAKAQKQCDKDYGNGHYKVISGAGDKSGGNVSARAGMNSKSMAGARYQSITRNQGY